MRFLALCLALVTVPALAQSQPKPAAKKPPVQKVDFNDPDLINGTLQGPDGEVVVGKPRPVFESFKLVRDNFNDKLMASVDEM
ncbi:MAG: hypothetical protein AB1938_18290 [Myxococcota bacterium]